MTSIVIQGTGAVSPAGWSVSSLRDALAKGEPLPTRVLPHPASGQPLRVRSVPPASSKPAFLNHPRLRRASPITHFAVSAALEALGSDAARVKSGHHRLGIVFCVLVGCVNYTRRFFEETLHDPATASPLLFPETVFNAPASHLAALLETTAPNYTLVGDAGSFLAGLGLAAGWLSANWVDSALVVSAEEGDWLIGDAARRFERGTIVSEGAGALYLRRHSHESSGVRLECITDAHTYRGNQPTADAVRAMRAQLPLGSPDQLLCDSRKGTGRADHWERLAWEGWPGTRISAKTIFGEGLAAGSAWQCVAAVDAVWQRRHPSAIVSVVGTNQQAIGASFAWHTGARGP